MNKLSTTNSNINTEIINIFSSKFLNFIRNPFSIKKILNTFPALTNVHPTNSIHYENFKRIINGKKPQQNRLCQHLDISESEYIKWLQIIFLLLTPLDRNKQNFLEQTIKGLFESSDLFITILIYTYDEKTCLLSDRGYSTPLPEPHMAFDFNLQSNAFIRYIFSDINSLIPENISKELVKSFKSKPKLIQVQRHTNDLDALKKYNRNVVYQCAETVFNSSIECHGL